MLCALVDFDDIFIISEPKTVFWADPIKQIIVKLAAEILCYAVKIQTDVFESHCLYYT